MPLSMCASCELDAVCVCVSLCLSPQVLTGEIPGDVLVTLSAEEMASSDMRAKNEQVGEGGRSSRVNRSVLCS